MTDRGLPIADGSPACPFVAFEDDRDERADRPDHRHRCFAEAVPAPRALAHQEAYCLSSAFPVCPTFQEWARREAAHANPAAAGADVDDAADAEAGIGAAGVAAAAAATRDEPEEPAEDLWSQPAPEPPIEERPRRNPPRDWAAPPPWASGASAASAAGLGAAPVGRSSDGSASQHDAPPEGQGLAGSAADRLARGEDLDAEWAALPPTRPRPTAPDSPAAPADPDLAGLVSGAARQAAVSESHVDVRPPAKAGRRPTVSSTRDRGRERDRERERAAAAGAAAGHDGPSWEKARRYEAYPSIKTRANLPTLSGIPTIGILAGGVLLAAIVLFFLPGVLGIGGGDDGGAVPSASPSSAVEESPSISPTPVPAPTPTTYTIKANDTLSKIARQFNVSLDALLAANKETIKNPNRIRVGDEIIIPLPETEEVPAASSASPSG